MNVASVLVPQQHLYPFALIYFAHKTTLETIAFFSSIEFLYATSKELCVWIYIIEENFQFCFLIMSNIVLSREKQIVERKLYGKRNGFVIKVIQK